MNTDKKITITIETEVNAPVWSIWKYWTTPEDIIHWNTGSDDWHTPKAVNDLRAGGRFSFRMESKDGKNGFDFEGTYTRIIENKQIDYTIIDGRAVSIHFSGANNATRIIESFEVEATNPVEIQKKGWQTILNNFKSYVESKK